MRPDSRLFVWISESLKFVATVYGRQYPNGTFVYTPPFELVAAFREGARERHQWYMHIDDAIDGAIIFAAHETGKTETEIRQTMTNELAMRALGGHSVWE